MGNVVNIKDKALNRNTDTVINNIKYIVNQTNDHCLKLVDSTYSNPYVIENLHEGLESGKLDAFEHSIEAAFAIATTCLARRLVLLNSPNDYLKGDLSNYRYKDKEALEFLRKFIDEKLLGPTQ